MRSDFLEFKKYYKDTIIKIPAVSFFKQSIDNKFKHSLNVLHTGIRIMAETPELESISENFQILAKRALLFHDVGRFEEAVTRYHTPNLTVDTESLNQYDHGLLGYQTLKSNPTYNDIRILLAIKYHGKMMEEVKASSLWEEAQNGEHKKEAEQILYLVRDADKLANLEKIKKNDKLRKDFFFKLLTKEALISGLSQTVKKQFFAKQTILFPTVHSFADRILMVLSWFFDLNFQKSKEMFKQKEYTKYLLDLLAQYHTLTKDIEEIRLFTEDSFK